LFCLETFMHIVVCVKQIINPETPAAAFRINPETKRAIPSENYPMVISDYDQAAVEAALRIKEAKGGKVTVISLGDPSATVAIKHCLAMGADDGILLCDPLFEEEDRSLVAHVLAAAIKKLGAFDLILCGRQEGDWDGGQVGPGIAEILTIPSVSPVRKVEVKDGMALVVRILDDGYEVIETPLPAVLGVSGELGTPRYPTMKGIMAAARKDVLVWSAREVSAHLSRHDPFAARVKMIKLFIPVHESACEFVTGETPEEAGANLHLKLREAKLI
jgi:electron transfer flavoprotein beta subunit